MFWDTTTPTLIASAPARPDRPRPLHPGDELVLTLGAGRVCVGRWDHRRDARVCCPRTIGTQGTDAQCPECANLDRGRSLARNVHLDARTYLLYLAAFDTDRYKVGLTAAERGTRRLLEQGALAHTLLARGPLTAIRRAEQAVALATVATERLTLRTKAAAWYTLTSTHVRRAALEAVHARALSALSNPDDLELCPSQVSDHVHTYGLDQRLDAAIDYVTALDDTAHLPLRMRAICGKALLAQRTNAPGAPWLLLDTRLLAGRPLAPHPEASALRGVHTRPLPRPHGARDDDQGTLF